MLMEELIDSATDDEVAPLSHTPMMTIHMEDMVDTQIALGVAFAIHSRRLLAFGHIDARVGR